MANELRALVAGALTGVSNPRVNKDVISAGMIENLEVGGDGVVSFTFVLSRDDPHTLVREARRAVRDIAGVSEVRIKVEEPAAETPPTASGGVPRPPKPKSMPELGRVIAISSGKGGVGKSTVSTNLAASLALGHSVGLMDADVYGPNIPRMFGVDEQPTVKNSRIIPLEAHGVKLMSLGFVIDRDTPAIWRGPIIMKVIQQFVGDVDWGKLDYLIVDLPPGTGDAQLSLVQTIQVESAIIVTTPQQVATGDALRGAKMFEKVNVPVVGVVENMSGFVCPHCGEHTDLFDSGGGEDLAQELGVPLLAQIPLQADLAAQADA
ncbi:MAG: P-loop NTPase, partial [Gemmatimonadales bacterium]